MSDSQHVIPLELYRYIVEAIDPSDRSALLSLLLTSPCLREEAERVLYSDVYTRDAKSQQLFLQTIIDCPRVARLVLKYHSLLPVIECFGFEPCWKLLPAALRSLVNLKELQYENPLETTADILRGCTFRLVSLHWGTRSDEIELSKFLARQEALEMLRISCWSDKYPGPPASALQKLTYLAGTYGMVLAFLPGRNITHLWWQPRVDDPHPDIPTISPALCNLRKLVFGGCLSQPALSILVDHLPNLQFLELISALEGDLLCIHRLPRLVGLVVSWWRRGAIPREGHLEFFTGLYSKCTSLRFIDISIKAIGQSDEYQRWYRNSQEPVKISRAFAVWGRLRGCSLAFEEGQPTTIPMNTDSIS